MLGLSPLPITSIDIFMDASGAWNLFLLQINSRLLLPLDDLAFDIAMEIFKFFL